MIRRKLLQTASALVLAFGAQATAQTPASLEYRHQALGELTNEETADALRRDGRVALSGAFFETDSDALSEDASDPLFKLATAMALLGDVRVAVVGHTDATGDFAYNIDLSQRRAEAIVAALTGEPYGVDPERLVAMGAGPIQPVASNLSEEGRALNRRVTFVILGDQAIADEAVETPEQDYSRFIENEAVDTILGRFEFEKGFPTEETTERLFDIRTTYRAMEVIQQNTFAASLYAMRKGFAEAGAARPEQVLVWFDRMDAKSEFLTANTDTVYAITFLDLKTDGPTVVEAPARMIGFMDDMWMRYVTDIGAAGPDKGEGGKFLILPPGYEGDVPEGYFVASSRTFGVWLALRARLDADGGNAEAQELYSQLRIYPLSEADDPRPTELINASGMEILTVHSENYELLEELGALVEEEHPDAVDGAQKFLLASIGMEFGKPFDPPASEKPLLERAARLGVGLLRANMWEYTGDQKYIYEDGKWWNPFVGGVYTFDPNGYLDYDAQAFFAAYATGVTPAMATKKPGVGSQYLCTHTDASGEVLDGAKTYKLTIPADVPAKDFWSVTVYDSASRSMMITDQQFPAKSSYSDVEENADGTIDIWFGPEAPEGKEANWVKTDPDKGWTAIFRLYGPLEPFFEQIWKLPDIEPVEG